MAFGVPSRSPQSPFGAGTAGVRAGVCALLYLLPADSRSGCWTVSMSESRRPGVEYLLVVLFATLAMSIEEFRRFSCRKFSVMADSAAGGTPMSGSESIVLRVMMRSMLLVMKDGLFRSCGRTGRTSLSSKNVQLADSSNRTRLTGFAIELSWLQVDVFDVRLVCEVKLVRPLLRLSWRPLNVVVSDDGVLSVSIVWAVPMVSLRRRKSGSICKNSSIDNCFASSTEGVDGIVQGVASEEAIVLCLLFFNLTSSELRQLLVGVRDFEECIEFEPPTQRSAGSGSDERFSLAVQISGRSNRTREATQLLQTGPAAVYMVERTVVYA